MGFLTAEWRNLALITYAVDPQVLAPVVPRGCTPDNRHGQAFVSLVAFEFLNTRVRGVRWPGHVCFPEVNLRFYVRRGEERGVSFIRELVPSAVTAWIARTLYNEPYSVARMRSSFRRAAGRVCVDHAFSFAGTRHTLRVVASDRTTRPGDDSLAHFLKEHKWGFVPARSGAVRRYEVQHPAWDVYEDAHAEVSVDFAAYGPRWAFLNQAVPCSVILAVGSEISVFPHAAVAA
jgi:uncharacterized protein